MLTAPRVHYAMAVDGVFFRSVPAVDPRTAAPVAAIVLQGIWAIVVACSGKYEQILNYVVSVDFIWFGMTGCALLILRRRNPHAPGYRAPGHPYTTLFFVACKEIHMRRDIAPLDILTPRCSLWRVPGWW